MYVGSRGTVESERNDMEISQEVEHGSCNKLPQPLLGMFSGENIYPYNTKRNVAEKETMSDLSNNKT